MEQKGHFQTLTSLKGLFILIIVLHNTLNIVPVFTHVPGTAFLKLFGGVLGNSMFFILSGFLLSVGYRDKIRTRTVTFPGFLCRRLQKLYPMYLLSNGAMLILEVVLYGVSAINIRKILFTLLLVGGPYNNPTWFLCALFVCYILFFAIAYSAKSSTHYVCYITAAVIAGYLLLGADLDLLFLNEGNGSAYMNFFLGCILAEVYPLLREKQHRWLQPLFLVLLPLLMYLMLAYGVEIVAGDVKVAFSFAICPMILYLALVKGPCSGILRFKGFVALGNISSSIFFWHLVLYLSFCELYTFVTGGQTLREPQYLLYFVLMLALSAGFSGLKKKKQKVLS